MLFSDAAGGRDGEVRGFTLVELLVVIGIIGLLMAILLPAMARARSSSQQIKCASILRQWGLAFETYAVEYKGVIPHSGDETRNPHNYQGYYDPAYPQNESCYINLLPPLMHRPAWKDYFAALPGTPLYGQRPVGDIWQCPLAQVLPDNYYDYFPSQTGYHSYTMNKFLDYGTPYNVPFLNLGKAREPSKTLLMYETTLNPALCVGTNSVSITCYAGYYPNDGPNVLGDRHPHQPGNLGGNLMMLDGHVEWTDHLYDPNDFPNGQTEPVGTDRTWWPYQPSNI